MILLRELDTLLAIFYKGDNYKDFLFAFLHTKHSEKGVLPESAYSFLVE